MKIPKIAGILAKAIAAKVGAAATEVAVEAIQAKAASMSGAKAVDAKRLKRHVLKIQRELKALESGIAKGDSHDQMAESAIKLHDTLFVGLAVLEDEIGEKLLSDPQPVEGTVTKFSGGSGKDRPDVSAE